MLDPLALPQASFQNTVLQQGLTSGQEPESRRSLHPQQGQLKARCQGVRSSLLRPFNLACDGHSSGRTWYGSMQQVIGNKTG